MKMKQLEKREISKLGHAVRVGAVMLLCGLPLWFYSCEKEIPGQGTGSGNVELQFILGSSSYDTDASESRSYGEPATEPETVVVPVGDDGLCLYATLASEPSNRLRASETIPDNTRVMIVAYKSDGSYESSAEYKVSGSGLVPTAATGRGLEISGGDTYTFVAYSLNTTYVPSYSSSVTISPSNDLLYGKSNPILMNTGSNTISISMRHKSCSQVKVSVTAASTITALTGVSLSPIYSSAKMQVWDGTLGDPSGSGSRVFTFLSLGRTTVTSDSILVYTGARAFGISVGSITAGSLSASSISAAFNNTILLPGKKYTLNLNFSKIQFAASNIYWDGSKLTFDEYVANPPASSMQKQGVFFKWGSLVGISPAPTSGAANNGYAFVAGMSVDSTEATSTRIYVPYYKNNKEYLNGSNLTEKVWTQTKAGTKHWYSMTEIPYHTIGFSGSGDRNDNTLIDASNNTVSDWQSYKGDICQFIDNNYRLPYSWEFGTGTVATGKWTGWYGTGGLGNAAGTYDVAHYGVTNVATGYFFPASSYRRSEGTLYDPVGSSGYYWSGSRGSSGGNYAMTFNRSEVYLSEKLSSLVACTVRCIKK